MTKTIRDTRIRQTFPAANSSSARLRPPAAGWRSASTCRSASAQQAQNAGNEVGIWVVVKPNNDCVIRIARSEMGQGTLTGLAQLVAEELECDWSRVSTEGLTPGPEPRPQARLGRHVDRRQPRHPRLAGLRPPRRRGRAHDAAAGGGQRMEGAGRRADGSERHHPARGVEAPDHLRPGCRGRGEAHAAGSEDHQAQGSEGLEDRRQADEAARHGRQAQRQQGLCDRRQAAGHAQRRDQGQRRSMAASSRATTRPRSPRCPASARS